MSPHFEYSVHGPEKGNWITLSHPIGSSMSLWDKQIRRFAKDHRVLSYNLRGHGRGALGHTVCTVQDLANDVLQLWQQLGIDRSHFVGMSLGGCIGVALANQAPQKVQSLVVANSRLEMDEPTSAMWKQRAKMVIEQGMECIVSMTIERWLTDDFIQRDPAAVESVRQTLQDTSTNGFASCAHALSEMHLQSILPQLSTPTLFVSGLADKAISTAMVEQYASLNPKFKFAAMAGPHILNLENPKEFEQSVMEFISLQP